MLIQLMANLNLLNFINLTPKVELLINYMRNWIINEIHVNIDIKIQFILQIKERYTVLY